MSKIMILSRLVIPCGLAATAVGALGAAPASAAEGLPFRSPALKVCKLSPTGYRGLFSESHCATNTANGTWAWATPGNGGADTWYCL